jgi:hypothetical protein
MKVIPDFENELKKIDANLAVRPNGPHKVFPELEKIASVTYIGADLFSIPSGEIYDETVPSYGVDVRGEGTITPHRNRTDALMLAMQSVERIKTSKDYRDLILGTGVYSDAALKSNDTKGETELVDEVEMELKEVGGASDHAHTLPK